MRANRIVPGAAWGLSFLLGQASALMGVMLAMGWLFGFAVALPRAHGWSAAPTAMLPIDPPLVGLTVGALGLLVARWSPRPIARYAIAGVVFNAVALTLALVLAWLRAIAA